MLRMAVIPVPKKCSANRKSFHVASIECSRSKDVKKAVDYETFLATGSEERGNLLKRGVPNGGFFPLPQSYHGKWSSECDNLVPQP